MKAWSFTKQAACCLGNLRGESVAWLKKFEVIAEKQKGDLKAMSIGMFGVGPGPLSRKKLKFLLPPTGGPR
jgi:hypothetical protein